MARIFDYTANKGSLYSETGVLGVVTGGLLHTKCNKGWMLPCTASKYITFTLPSLAQKSIITVTKVNNTYTVTQTNTTATITSLVLNNANYLRYIIYDSVASATSDLKNIQAWVNILQPLTYQKRQLSLPKHTELRESGLVAAYNMKPVGNVLHDISGNGNHITLANCIQTINGLRSKGNGYSAYTESSMQATNNILTANTIWSICVKINNYTAGSFDPFLGGGTNANHYIALANLNSAGYVSFRDTGSAFNNFTSLLTSYLNGKSFDLVFTANGTTISAYLNGVFIQTITPTNGTGFTLRNILRGYTLGGYSPKFEYIDFRAYNRVVTTQEIKAYHNSFNEVILHEKFEDMAVGSSRLPQNWIAI